MINSLLIIFFLYSQIRNGEEEEIKFLFFKRSRFDFIKNFILSYTTFLHVLKGNVTPVSVMEVRKLLHHVIRGEILLCLERF